MSCEVKNVVIVRQGSKESIQIRLTDKRTGERLDLSQFESGKVIFKTTAGVTIEKVITFPVTDPKLGVISFDLLSADTSQFDRQMRDMEVVLDYTASDEDEIFTLRNSMEVEERL